MKFLSKALIVLVFFFFQNLISAQTSENLALNKPASQSDTYGSDAMGQASNVTDGNRDGARSNYSTNHTTFSRNDWWKVDLGSIVTINRIEVYNRTDSQSMASRLAGATLYVGNVNSTNPNEFDVVEVLQGTLSMQQFDNLNISARYVMIHHPSNFIHIAEVEVYGTPATDSGGQNPPDSSQNLALGKAAIQASNHDSDRTASNAVDGNSNIVSNTVAQTAYNGNNPWWEVDLGSPTNISRIDIYNGSNGVSERLAGAKVYVGNNSTHNPIDYTEVTTVSLTGSTAVQQVNVSNLTARYVMVYLPKNYTTLHLAEVEVYGSSSNPNPNPDPSGSSQWAGDENNITYGGTVRMDGNVGVGTNALSSYKLAVDGKIRSREVRVDSDLDWADYVFEKDYKLPTLKEVEQHIAEKGHLINIPSAEEVQANGILLGEMNKLLLEKIEELTLYILKLNSKNKLLEERIFVLEKID